MPSYRLIIFEAKEYYERKPKFKGASSQIIYWALYEGWALLSKSW